MSTITLNQESGYLEGIHILQDDQDYAIVIKAHKPDAQWRIRVGVYDRLYGLNMPVYKYSGTRVCWTDDKHIIKSIGRLEHGEFTAALQELPTILHFGNQQICLERQH